MTLLATWSVLAQESNVARFSRATCGNEARRGSQQLRAVTPASFCCVVRAMYRDNAPPWKDNQRKSVEHILCQQQLDFLWLIMAIKEKDERGWLMAKEIRQASSGTSIHPPTPMSSLHRDHREYTVATRAVREDAQCIYMLHLQMPQQYSTLRATDFLWKVLGIKSNPV